MLSVSAICFSTDSLKSRVKLRVIRLEIANRPVSPAWKRFQADAYCPSGSVLLIQPRPDLGEVPRQ